MEIIPYNNREEWLAIRQTGLGGSDIAAALGVSPWKTPVELWMEKTGQPTENSGNPLMLDIGSALEDLVASTYETKTGRKVERYPYTLRDGALVGNVDRLIIPAGKEHAADGELISTDGILECKTSRKPWDDEEGVPIYYLTQVLTYMALCPTVQYVDVACIFLLGATFDSYRVERNDQQIQSLKEFASEWWKKYVLLGEKPEPRTERDCTLLWARSSDKPVAATTSIVEKAYRIAEIRALKKKLNTVEDMLKRDIALFMQDCDTLTDERGSNLLTYKTGRMQFLVDWMGLAIEVGFTQEQLERHSSEKPGVRRLLIDKYIQRAVNDTPISKLLGITPCLENTSETDVEDTENENEGEQP